MEKTNLELYWSSQEFELPQRSRLIRLDPVGIGTARVEGLASYIVRLAGAHSVSPKRLVRTAYAAVEPEITDVVERGSFFSWGGRSINGLGRYADLFCRATTALTCTQDLHLQTLLSLRHLLPDNCKGLLARHPQWCPSCLAERAVAGEEAYRPLVWSFRLYRHCSLHRRPLVEHCPVCGSFQDFIPKYPCLNYCSRCRAWLGREEGAVPAWSSADDWTCRAIEDVVANLLSLGRTATVENFRHALVEAIQAYAGGSLPIFCREIGLGVVTLRKWFAKRTPSFPQWLALSYGLGIWPSQFFTGTEKYCIDARRLRRHPLTVTFHGQRPWLTVDEQRALRAELVRIAADPGEMLSLSAVARRLHKDLGSLKYWAPAECTRIRDRYAEIILARAEQRRSNDVEKLEAIIGALINEGQYPSVGRVNQALRKQGRSLVQPELRRAYRAAVSRRLGQG